MANPGIGAGHDGLARPDSRPDWDAHRNHRVTEQKHRPVVSARAPLENEEGKVNMVLGKVIGTVVATRKEEELVGLKFLIVRGIDLEAKATSTLVVAADAVGAGVGEVVLYASGSAARQTEMTRNRPVDAVIMAIVDELAVNDDLRYVKE